MEVRPIKLDGDSVTLEPLKHDHIEPLSRFCFDQSIWRWYPYAIRYKDDLEFYVNDALAHQALGTHLPFVIFANSGKSAVGCTRFMNIDVKNRRAEIGSTWLDPNWQRTSVNTEAKLLLLTHAFETWKCIRVEFKTDALNQRSRDAILRLGAKEEGTLRQHMITESGRMRDSVYFSILDAEWDNIKIRLADKLKNYQ
ncbi:MAG: GNAT family protein [Pyrinomonadaceae bacterium]